MALSLSFPAAAFPAAGSSAAEQQEGVTPAVPEADGEESEEKTAGDEEPAPEEIPWLDWMRREMHRTVDGAARWFDGFFGNARYDEESEKSYGLLAVDTLREGDEDPDVDVDFRARVALPNLNRRFDALFGREGDREPFADRLEEFDLPAGFRQASGQRDWLLGLGYRPPARSKSRLSYEAGVKLRFPLDPFVQGRYRYQFLFGEAALVRLHETIFWRGEDGFGSTSSADLDRVLGTHFLLRWGNTVTFHEKTDGVAWASGLTLFQNLGEGRAMAYQAGLEGETDAPVALRRYGVRATYRQSVLREWLFGEVVAGLVWPQELPAQDREAEWVVGVGIEIQFGERP